MPRVSIKKPTYMASDLCDFIRRRMREMKLTQRDLAKELSITQQGLSYRLAQCSFEYKELLKIFEVLKFTDQEILKAMKKMA